MFFFMNYLLDWRLSAWAYLDFDGFHAGLWLWFFFMDNLLDYDGSHEGLWWSLWIYDATADLCFIGDFKHISESMTCGLYRTHFICFELDMKILIGWLGCQIIDAVSFSSTLQNHMPTESIIQLVMLWVTMLMITIYIFFSYLTWFIRNDEKKSAKIRLDDWWTVMHFFEVFSDVITTLNSWFFIWSVKDIVYSSWGKYRCNNF